MPWIQSHQSLGSHPKLLQFAKECNLSLPTAVGAFHYLWWWALGAASDGVIHLSAENLVYVMELRVSHKTAVKIVESLEACGWLDRVEGGWRLHDWSDYGGLYLRLRDGKRRRQQRSVTRVAKQRKQTASVDETLPSPRPGLTVIESEDPP